LREIKTPCRIAQGFNPAHGTAPEMHEFQALWDTGATNSVITQAVVDKCGLKPVGMAKVHGVFNTTDCEQYLVNILLPSQVGFAHVKVTRAGLPQGTDVLLGMDIIAGGDFAVTQEQGNTVVSFRYPSQTTTDFVKDLQEAQNAPPATPELSPQPPTAA